MPVPTLAWRLTRPFEWYEHWQEHYDSAKKPVGEGRVQQELCRRSQKAAVRRAGDPLRESARPDRHSSQPSQGHCDMFSSTRANSLPALLVAAFCLTVLTVVALRFVGEGQISSYVATALLHGVVYAASVIIVLRRPGAQRRWSLCWRWHCSCARLRSQRRPISPLTLFVMSGMVGWVGKGSARFSMCPPMRLWRTLETARSTHTSTRRNARSRSIRRFRNSYSWRALRFRTVSAA